MGCIETKKQMGGNVILRSADECVIILGSYINASTIASSLQKIDYPHPIILFDTMVSQGKCMADIVLKDVVVIKKKIVDPDEIVLLINQSMPGNVKKTILSTSEVYLDPLKDALSEGRLQNTVAYTGAGIGNEVIFDRFQFYRFVEKLNCVAVPDTIAHTEDPIQKFGQEFVIRVKRSWNGSKKLPSLQIAHGQADRERIERGFLKEGLTPDMWCYQELLSTDDKHNVSVCGWHDKDNQQYIVTRKVLQHPPKTGNGDVVENLNQYPQELMDSTREILTAMDYSGPFEMEFVYDTHENQYKVIELNPRFWMQHGLFERLTNYSLIKRCLRQVEQENDAFQAGSLTHRYWINGNQLLYRLIKGQWGVLKYLKNGECFPGVMQSLVWSMHYRKYKKRFKSENKYQ